VLVELGEAALQLGRVARFVASDEAVLVLVEPLEQRPGAVAAAGRRVIAAGRALGLGLRALVDAARRGRASRRRPAFLGLAGRRLGDLDLVAVDRRLRREGRGEESGNGHRNQGVPLHRCLHGGSSHLPRKPHAVGRLAWVTFAPSPTEGAMKRTGYCAAIAILLSGAAWAEHPASSSNMTLLAHQDLQGRSAYQPVIRENKGRWIAYVGHHGGK